MKEIRNLPTEEPDIIDDNGSTVRPLDDDYGY